MACLVITSLLVNEYSNLRLMKLWLFLAYIFIN